MISRRGIIIGGTAALVAAPAGAISLLTLKSPHAGGLTLDPQSIVVVSSASSSFNPGTGRYTITADFDSSIRFLWDLTKLVGGLSYTMAFNVISVTGGPAEYDWCDGTAGGVGTVPAGDGIELLAGAKSFTVSRPSYDATYRFLDIGSNALDPEEAATTVVMTAPTITPQ